LRRQNGERLSPPAPDPKDLDALGERLDEARGRDQARKPQPQVTPMGVAFRFTTELVTALVVGGALGYGLDWLFGTRPIFIVVMFLLGAATGIRNVMNAASEINAQMAAAESNKDNGEN
jgi:ATP synthase protein I